MNLKLVQGVYMIYLDNAGTTKPSVNAISAMMPYLTEEFGNPSSLYALGGRAKDAIEKAREEIASCINANASEIVFTSGGSESDNQAILSAVKIGARKGKNHIITTKFEHHAVLNTLKKLEKQGYEVTYLDVYNDGLVRIEDLKNAITDKTCLVTIMFANNEIGTIEPIEEIGKVCRERGIIFHTDAVQAVGHEPIDVKRMNIDLLSSSAHKFHGVKGVGFLYARRGVLLTDLISGGAQEKGKRAGTENVAGIIAMATALKESVATMQEDNKRMKYLRDKLIDELSKIPHSELNGDREHRLASNFNMCFEGIEGEALLLHLDDFGICASSGSACTSGSLDPSHVLLAIGRPHAIAHGSLRLTLSRYTTEWEIDYVIEKVKIVVEYLRNMSPLWKRYVKGELAHVI